MSIPRNNSLVYFDFESLPSGYDTTLYPFKKDYNYIFLGEIPNMPGYCIIVDPITNDFYSKYDINLFKEYLKGESI